MAINSSFGAQLYERGWKQGTYIDCPTLSGDLRNACWAGNPNLKDNLLEHLCNPLNVLILLTQACDIVAPCRSEPVLEFVIAQRTNNKKANSSNLDARSCRFLELKLNQNWHKAEAAKILYIPKQILFEETDKINFSLSCLDDKDSEILARWRANRYMRVALPDKFNDKIKSLVDNRLFHDGLDHAGGLYLQLDPFSESDQYLVRLFALQGRGSPNDTYAALYEKMESILEAINKVEGLTCLFIEGDNEPVFEGVTPVMRRHELSVGLRDYFVRWNFDHISLGNDYSTGIDED